MNIATTTEAAVIVIGSVEALGLIADKLHLEGGFWRLIGALADNLTNFGYAVVAIFLASWIVSTAIYRARGYDRLRPSPP